jgi:hypothetical protein
MEERYPDTIEVDGSNPSVITVARSSMESFRLLTGRPGFDTLRANQGCIAQWKSGGLLSRGLKVQIFLHPQKMWVRRSWTVVAVCKTVVCGHSWFESIHPHRKEGKVGAARQMKRLFAMSEFDNEEKDLDQYLLQTARCFGRMAKCTGVKSRISWFNSTGHHLDGKGNN